MYTKECKIMLAGSKQERFELFKREFVNPLTPEANQIPITSYYPTSDYKSVIHEITEAFSFDFQVSGKNSDFVRQNLIESSYFKSSYINIAKECILAKKAFVVPRIRIDNDDLGKDIFTFNLQVLPYDECVDVYDDITGKLVKLIHEKQEEVFDIYEQPVTAITVTTYTMDFIIKEFWDFNGKRIAGQDTITTPNPYKQYDVFPVFVFESMSEYDKPIAYDLVEQQLQIENLNFNIENGINYQGMPVWAIENTMRNWNGVSIAPNTVLGLMGDEKLSQVGGNLNLDALRSHMIFKMDNLYRQAGLTPPSMRESIYDTDSINVTKMAQAPLINKIKIIMNFHRQPMDLLAKLILQINGKEYFNESVIPSEEILPVDLQSVLSTWTIGMNLGLLDDEAFWVKYFPAFTDKDKDRIKDFFEKRFQSGNLDSTNGVNLNNNAKSSKPVGNKKQATQMTKEERDKSVKKSE